MVNAAPRLTLRESTYKTSYSMKLSVSRSRERRHEQTGETPRIFPRPDQQATSMIAALGYLDAAQLFTTATARNFFTAAEAGWLRAVASTLATPLLRRQSGQRRRERRERAPPRA